MPTRGFKTVVHKPVSDVIEALSTIYYTFYGNINLHVSGTIHVLRQLLWNIFTVWDCWNLLPVFPHTSDTWIHEWTEECVQKYQNHLHFSTIIISKPIFMITPAVQIYIETLPPWFPSCFVAVNTKLNVAPNLAVSKPVFWLYFFTCW